MLAPVDEPTPYRLAVRSYVQAILNGSLPPYHGALKIFGRSGREWPAMDGDEARTPLMLIWAALADWVELRPAETDSAECQMIAAASEWLAVEGDAEAEASYFERWCRRRLNRDPLWSVLSSDPFRVVGGRVQSLSVVGVRPRSRPRMR
jgi:hypothetical protein